MVTTWTFSGTGKEGLSEEILFEQQFEDQEPAKTYMDTESWCVLRAERRPRWLK